MKAIEEQLAALSARLTEVHQVAVHPQDPLLMTLTATMTIIDESIQAACEAQKKVLADHEAQLEVQTTRWSRHVEVTALSILDRVKGQTVEAAEEVIAQAADGAAEEMREMLTDHRRHLRIVTWTASLIVALAVVVAAFVLARGVGN